MHCSIFILILIGLLIGFLGGYAGISGSPFMIAGLVFLCGLNQHTAQGTVLTAMLGPMSLMALLKLKNETRRQWKNILIGILTYAVFSWFGAVGAFHYGDAQLKKFFAVLLILVAIFQFLPIRTEGERSTNIPALWMLITGALAGIIGGFFGVGAGVLLVPVFMGLFRLDKNHARALSLGILLPPVSLGAFFKYHAEHAIVWSAVGILFAAYFVANWFGAHYGNRAKARHFKIVYGLILVSLALLYWFK